MTEQEQRAALSICFMAALADGATEVERAAIKRSAERLGSAGLDLNALYEDVVAGRTKLADVAGNLQTDAARKAAYEMATAVCDADGAANAEEKKFLDSLRGALNLPAQDADKMLREAEAVAATPVAAAAAASMSEAEQDKMILNYAILNGALELLPETLSNIAIIPLQMKMVYRIGKSHGFELDQSYIKDFLGTLGIGLTSQVFEGVARKLLGGIFGGVGRQAASSAVAFGTTYALGQLAKRYYAGGRKLDSAEMKQLFSKLLGDATAMKDKYSQEIQQKMGEIKGTNIASLVKQQ
jgi:uncharacterized protein (DUF697 family)/tellurite resistance protein